MNGCEISVGQLLVVETQVQTQAPQFVYKYVEGFRYAGTGDIVSLDDGLVGLGTSDDVVRLEGEQFLEDV